MMLAGRQTGQVAHDEPCVVQIQISRATRALPRPGERLGFLVALHVEGSPVTWQRNATLRPPTESRLLAQIDDLRMWSVGMALTPDTARATAIDIGRTLRDVFLGDDGLTVLAALDPTAILVIVDETVIHLPWEMMLDGEDEPLVLTPFGRVVTTRAAMPGRRDLAHEDPTVKILAIENPTDDLPGTERVLEVIESQRGAFGDTEIVVTTLERAAATRAGFVEAITGRDYDIIHFAGHGHFDTRRPQDVALVLADGELTDDDVLGLPWAQPPFVVVNGSCESARSAAGRRVVSRRRANGLAAAFLSRGVEAYLGHYLPVEDVFAAEFSAVFYATLIQRRNVGTAVQEAREQALRRFASDADLTGLNVVFFGDAGTAERRDLATAV